VFVLPKWAKFNAITRRRKLYQEFSARTQLFERQLVADPTRQGVVAPAPRHVQLWLVDANYVFYDSAVTTSDIPTSVHVPSDEPTASIATLRHFFTDATALRIDLTELNVKNHDGSQLISGLVDCAATHEFGS
jgi:hypothetical protein